MTKQKATCEIKVGDCVSFQRSCNGLLEWGTVLEISNGCVRLTWQDPDSGHQLYKTIEFDEVYGTMRDDSPLHPSQLKESRGTQVSDLSVGHNRSQATAFLLRCLRMINIPSFRLFIAISFAIIFVYWYFFRVRLIFIILNKVYPIQKIF